RPARVGAHGPVAVLPDSRHRIEVGGLEGVVEGLVRRQHVVGVLARGGAGAGARCARALVVGHGRPRSGLGPRLTDAGPGAGWPRRAGWPGAPPATMMTSAMDRVP